MVDRLALARLIKMMETCLISQCVQGEMIVEILAQPLFFECSLLS